MPPALLSIEGLDAFQRTFNGVDYRTATLHKSISFQNASTGFNILDFTSVLRVFADRYDRRERRR